MKSKKHKDPCLLICSRLGIVPTRTELYAESLTHSSLCTQKDGGMRNNERLEFLGDSVLGLVFAERLFRDFPEKSEGELSVVRARLAKRETLNKAALEMGFGEFLRLPEHARIQKEDIYGNALEAFCGAVFLDKGYDFCRAFVEREIVEKHINFRKMLLSDTDYKSKLLGEAQKRKIDIKFVLDFQKKTEKDEHFFCTKVYLGDTEIGIGTGLSKKESQQNAAKMALRKI